MLYLEYSVYYIVLIIFLSYPTTAILVFDFYFTLINTNPLYKTKSTIHASKQSGIVFTQICNEKKYDIHCTGKKYKFKGETKEIHLHIFRKASIILEEHSDCSRLCRDSMHLIDNFWFGRN